MGWWRVYEFKSRHEHLWSRVDYTNAVQYGTRPERATHKQLTISNKKMYYTIHVTLVIYYLNGYQMGRRRTAEDVPLPHGQFEVR